MNFNDFPAFVREMKDQHIRLIPIIDAGVKIEDGYDVYEEGVKNRYFCQREGRQRLRGGGLARRYTFPGCAESRGAEMVRR